MQLLQIAISSDITQPTHVIHWIFFDDTATEFGVVTYTWDSLSVVVYYIEASQPAKWRTPARRPPSAAAPSPTPRSRRRWRPCGSSVEKAQPQPLFSSLFKQPLQQFSLTRSARGSFSWRRLYYVEDWWGYYICSLTWKKGLSRSGPFWKQRKKVVGYEKSLKFSRKKDLLKGKFCFFDIFEVKNFFNIVYKKNIF